MLSAFWLSFSFSSSFEKAGERMAKKGDYALLQPPSFGFHFSPVERTRTSFRKLYSPIATPTPEKARVHFSASWKGSKSPKRQWSIPPDAICFLAQLFPERKRRDRGGEKEGNYTPWLPPSFGSPLSPEKRTPPLFRTPEGDEVPPPGLV